MASLRSIVQLVAVLSVAADTANVADSTTSPQDTVDLSVGLAEDATAMTESLGAVAVIEAASSDPFIRSALVLENGRIVAKYYRDDVDEDEPHQVWSTTKSWTSLLVGLLVDEGKLSVEDTLGDIFQDDEAAWAGVEDGTVDFRKDVTIQEMLTMTSGLIDSQSLETVMAMMMEMGTEEREALMEAGLEASLGDGGVSGGGSSLTDSLAFPSVGPKGEFSYLATNQILSYVIKERTGMTPRQYLEDKVMPHLGIDESQYRWYQTEDGVEFAFHGLELTALQMAKFGQLYLQGGKSKPVPDSHESTNGTASDEHQLISKGWIDATFKPYAKDTILSNRDYGYLFWAMGTNTYCALGAFGQDICVDRSTGRVVVQQRDRDPENPIMGVNLIIAGVATDPDLSFAALSPDVSPQQASGSPGPTSVIALLLLGLPTLFF